MNTAAAQKDRRQSARNQKEDGWGGGDLSAAGQISVIAGDVDGYPFMTITIVDKGTCELRLKGETAGLRGLYVHPDYRRLGIGSALLQRALAEAEQRGHLAVGWTVKKTNAVALQFYAKHGATIFFDDDEDWWMAVPLDRLAGEGNAMGLIRAERARQVAKGFGAKHDDAHVQREIAMAAQTFLTAHCDAYDARSQAFELWPWRDTEPHFDGAIPDLVKAGALIVAEIERLQRQTAARGG